MKQQVHALPVVVRWYTLEDIEQCRRDGPEDNVDEVDPPGKFKPSLMDEKRTAIER